VSRFWRGFAAWAAPIVGASLAACGAAPAQLVRAESTTTVFDPGLGAYYEVPTDPAVFPLVIAMPAAVATGAILTIRGTCAFATDVSLTAFSQPDANPDPITGRRPPPEAAGLGSPAIAKTTKIVSDDSFEFVLPVTANAGVYFYRIACVQDDYWISDALTPRGLAIRIFPPERMSRIEVLPWLPKGALPPTG
jgi:hypothetical protein